MRIKIALIGLLFAASASVNVKASGNLSNVEAMFIYNFLRHVNWPSNAGGENFTIGVYGDSPVYDQLVQFTKNRKVGTKTIVVKKVASVEEAGTCQLVFVPERNSSKTSSLRSQLGNKPCLVVGEKEGSITSGSTIEFVIQDSKLKFRINEERAKQQNLVVSRALLDMAV